MDGIHDLGGLAGFGAVERDEASFHADWERRVFALALAAPLANVDAFRHAIERIDPITYLTAGYFGRWLAALELLAAESDPSILPSERTARRELERARAFRVGDRVRTRSTPVPGHTRLPRYARGHGGQIVRVHPAFVLPDTNAHGQGEHPEPVYGVRFDASDLFGAGAEPETLVHLDLFESYLVEDVHP